MSGRTDGKNARSGMSPKFQRRMNELARQPPQKPEPGSLEEWLEREEGWIDKALAEPTARLFRQVKTANPRVLVCGGRDFINFWLLATTMDILRKERGVAVVIAGGARGADTMVEEWAKSRGVECIVYNADWKGLGRKAGPIRNQRMLDEGKPDLVIAFPGGRGTADMVRKARAAGVDVIEVGAQIG